MLSPRSLHFVAAALLLVCAVPAQPVAMAVADVPPGAPVAVTSQATPELLVVELALQPEWHVYARDVGGGQPVALTLAPDCDYAAAGKLRTPPDAEGKLTGNVRLELPLASAGAGGSLRATLQLQVCDPLACLQPMAISISGDLARSFPVLLVVDQPDDRSDRIVAFLREREFDVDVATYETVTVEQCDRSGVVLADSKLFGKSRGTRQHVLKFPQSEAPIVAVGFFGTELIEAHGVAMTSGYI